MPYKECCIQNYISHPHFKRCPECAKLYYPCKGCPSLSDKHSHCPVCIYPRFLWKSPYPLKAGEMGAVELVVENQGKKSFFVQTIHYQLSGSAPQEKNLEEGLSPGQSRLFLLDCLSPPSAGAYSLSVSLTLSWREQMGGYSQEELFVYAGEILLTVLPSENKSINISDVKDARIIISASSYDTPLNKPISSIYESLSLKRSHKREFQSCSYKEGYRASRKTKILFPSLQTGEMQEFSFAGQNRVGFGRVLPEKNPAIQATLRLYPLEGQNLEISKTISSHHFDLVVMKGRLYIIDLSSFGTSLNHKAIRRGIPTQVQKGDLISPFTRMDYVNKLSFVANFQIQEKKVIGVELVRRDG